MAKHTDNASSSRWPKPFHLSLVALILFTLLYPMLARSPQNPDGAEMIMAAQQGGVLHSPGYPIQTWVNRLFIHLPLDYPAARLAVLSLLSGIVTAILILQILGGVRRSWPEALLGASWFLFYPTVWYLSVQPEKYIFACALFALMIAQMMSFGQRERDSFRLRDGLVLGILGACALLQHTTAVLMSPFAFASFYSLLGKKERRRQRALATIAAFTLCFLGLYLSLFLLTDAHAWPDWGKIQTLGDLVRIAILDDFASFQPAIQKYFSTSTAATQALPFFLADYWRAFNIAGILPLLGLPFLWRNLKKPAAVAFLFALLLNVAFLSVTSFPGEQGLVAETYLERYSIPLVLLLGILAGFGAMWIRDQTPRRFRRFASLVFLLTPLMLFQLGKESSDASKDLTLDLFREGLSLTQDPTSIYFAGTDLELFAGFETPVGVRFPVFGDYEWASRIVPQLEPRFTRDDFEGVKVSVQLALKAYQRGQTLMVSKPTILNGAPTAPVQKGLFWLLDSSTHPEYARDIPIAAAKLCTVIKKFTGPRPRQGYRYPRYVFDFFPTAYQSTAEFMDGHGDKTGALIAGGIAASLRDGSEPAQWQNACDQFQVRYPY